MDDSTFFLAILVVALLAVAVFSNVDGFGLGVSGPRADPPNPNAEFGVVHQQQSFFGGFFGSSGGNTPPPPPPPTQADDAAHHITLSEDGARESAPSREYVRISYSLNASSPLTLTGWTLSNTRGDSFSIGMASAFPASGGLTNQDLVVLQPGGSVYVITGTSPRGESFRKNKCTGYFNQFDSFAPWLPNECPNPNNEPGTDHVSDTCYQYVRSNVYGCVMPADLPLYLDNNCRDFIGRTASYNACINLHRHDSDFFGKEWWVYLGRPLHMWSDVRDTITLKDASGRVIATRSYN